MNLQNISDDLIFMEEEQDFQINPFYLIAATVDETRLKMFELVEIPHLCIQMQRCYFSFDMQCIKKAHQYMKQSISSSYYNEIKKNLQIQLGILIKSQQRYTDIYKLYEEDLNSQNDNISHHFISQLSHYFSNPNNSTFSSNNSPNLISDLSTRNNKCEFLSEDNNQSQTPSSHNFNFQQNQ